MTLFLRDENQVPIAINTINEFSKASGLSLNLSKCEIMSIRGCLTSFICSIPVRDELVFLGITITKDQLLSYNPKNKKIKIERVAITGSLSEVEFYSLRQKVYHA